MEGDPAAADVPGDAVRTSVPADVDEPCGGPDGAERSFKGADSSPDPPPVFRSGRGSGRPDGLPRGARRPRL